VSEEPIRDIRVSRAILGDVQFWIPALVLAAGVLLLIALH
jgi:hypothetical protein